MKNMKWMFVALMSLVGTFAQAHVGEPLYGSWRTAGVMYADPYVVTTGRFEITPSMIWVEVTCDYRQGTVARVSAEAPIEVYQGLFTILQGDYQQSGGYPGCVAQLNPGPVEYRYDERQGVLTLFNRQTGWRLNLVR